MTEICKVCHGTRMVNIPDMAELSIDVVEWDYSKPPPEVKTHNQPCPLCLRKFIESLREDK